MVFLRPLTLGREAVIPAYRTLFGVMGSVLPTPKTAFSPWLLCAHTAQTSPEIPPQWSVIGWVIQSPHLRMRHFVIFCSEPWPLSTVIPTSLKQFPLLPGRQVHSGYFAFSILTLAQ